MKKLAAILLTLAMAFTFTACGDSTLSNTAPTSALAVENGNSTSSSSTEAPGNSQGAEAIVCTYNLNMSTFPTSWNPHTYKTSSSADILSYITDSLYGFDYNEDKTGVTLVPFMAAEEPVDITNGYVGQFGIEEGDSGRVWKIVLRQDLVWQDGTPITAHTFVESARRLLNPLAQNSRAQELYAGGSVKIVNAERYLKQGSYGYTNFIEDAFDHEDCYREDGDFTLNARGQLTVEGREVWYAPGKAGQWGISLLEEFDEELCALCQELWVDTIKAHMNAEGYVPVTEEVRDALRQILALMYVGGSVEEYDAARDGDGYAYVEWQECCFVGQYAETVDWEEVGIFALSEYELVYALVEPCSDFTLMQELPDGYLVYPELYDACESVDEKTGNYTNEYGTSAATTMSYGPYAMDSFQRDEKIHFVRRDEYYGVKDGYYEATDVVIHCIPDPATRLKLFLAGELDVYGLQKEDMDTYLLCDCTYLTDSATVWGMVLNPDREALEKKQAEAGENINKTILTLKEFRQALAFGMDRTGFVLATAPAGHPSFGLLSAHHMVDAEEGLGYRNTQVGQEVLAEVWGVAEDIGEDGLYANVEEAVAAITGYAPELAREKFQEAYHKALALGLMDEEDVIEICIGSHATGTAYGEGYQFICKQYTELVKGTELEGKLTFVLDDTVGADPAGALRSHQVDMLFYVGYSGGELNPYGLIGAYCDGGNLQYDPVVEYSQESMRVELDGVEYTASVYDWFRMMNGTACIITGEDGTRELFSCGSADNSDPVRLKILGELEKTILQQYNFIPLCESGNAQLISRKVQFYSDRYMYGVGFGGLRYMTFSYNDGEWAEFVASQGGRVEYS